MDADATSVEVTCTFAARGSLLMSEHFAKHGFAEEGDPADGVNMFALGKPFFSEIRGERFRSLGLLRRIVA